MEVLMGKSIYKWAIFHGYVKLPEGNQHMILGASENRIFFLPKMAMTMSIEKWWSTIGYLEGLVP